MLTSVDLDLCKHIVLSTQFDLSTTYHLEGTMLLMEAGRGRGEEQIEDNINIHYTCKYTHEESKNGSVGLVARLVHNHGAII